MDVDSERGVGTDPLLVLFEDESRRRKRVVCVRVACWAVAGVILLGTGLGLGTLLR